MAHLAALLAGFCTGLLLAVGSVAIPGLCPVEGLGECGFGIQLAIGFFGLPLVMLPLALALRLGWFFWLAFLVPYAGWVATAKVDAWWWWLWVGVIPTFAAPASAEYLPSGLHPLQRGLILAGAGVAVGFLIWWYGFAG
ncbi:MAG: hypothetical protein IPL43_04015 [Micropruina sp.]|nr:hypothetical protein [Micropruina sp.]